MGRFLLSFFDRTTFEAEFNPKEELKKYKLWGRIEWNQIYIKLESVDNLTIESVKTIIRDDEKLKEYKLIGVVEGYDNNKYYAEIFVYEGLDKPFEEKQPDVNLKKIKK